MHRFIFVSLPCVPQVLEGGCLLGQPPSALSGLLRQLQPSPLEEGSSSSSSSRNCNTAKDLSPLWMPYHLLCNQSLRLPHNRGSMPRSPRVESMVSPCSWRSRVAKECRKREVEWPKCNNSAALGELSGLLGKWPTRKGPMPSITKKGEWLVGRNLRKSERSTFQMTKFLTA
ncbi:hypothetical protein DUNSADRAFT_4173 [Dunaliella salina]|uniref:Encoded protein n=1 Tax=Dunaliella salina TaxID=3046 RepID=A0ABQ7GSL8_DUNSA|nr:hypothetical protein DUNSADRAFT_4173 [Dunaliella salina]|eukprot:KAF5837602.1 hypothetical protein DUNSADRAFT_4173 [Dunaliella salina]